MTISRRRRFSTAHLYRQPKFTDSENRRHFGACYTEHGHGHNYTLEVIVEGKSFESAEVVTIDELLKDVCREFDHRHVNFDVPHFKDHVPTTENMAVYLHDRLNDLLHRRFAGGPVPIELRRTRLYEIEDLWVDVFASNAGALP